MVGLEPGQGQGSHQDRFVAKGPEVPPAEVTGSQAWPGSACQRHRQCGAPALPGRPRPRLLLSASSLASEIYFFFTYFLFSVNQNAIGFRECMYEVFRVTPGFPLS